MQNSPDTSPPTESENPPVDEVMNNSGGEGELASTVDAEVSEAWASVDQLVNGFFALLPKMVIASVVFILFLLLAWGVRILVSRITHHRRRANLGQVLGRLAQWCTIFVGLLVAVAIVAPSVTPAKLLSALGIGGVAIGFAFKDILQNFLAGILILLRQPFRVGDQVILGGHEGTVESIDTRSTVIKTYDGHRVLIPNGEVYTSPMVVLTAYEARRSQYDVGIGYADDIGKAAAKMLEIMQSTDGVLSDPAPDVLVVDLAGSTVILRARWWTDPHKNEVVTSVAVKSYEGSKRRWTTRPSTCRSPRRSSCFTTRPNRPTATARNNAKAGLKGTILRSPPTCRAPWPAWQNAANAAPATLTKQIRHPTRRTKTSRPRRRVPQAMAEFAAAN